MNQRLTGFFFPFFCEVLFSVFCYQRSLWVAWFSNLFQTLDKMKNIFANMVGKNAKWISFQFDYLLLPVSFYIWIYLLIIGIFSLNNFGLMPSVHFLLVFFSFMNAFKIPKQIKTVTFWMQIFFQCHFS